METTLKGELLTLMLRNWADNTIGEAPGNGELASDARELLAIISRLHENIPDAKFRLAIAAILLNSNIPNTGYYYTVGLSGESLIPNDIGSGFAREVMIAGIVASCTKPR